MKEKPKKSVRMWVARDKNNKLNELFPSVKWEDKEPTRVVLRLI